MDKNFAKTYKLLSILGTGGMSEVYLAQNIKTGTKVAIKILDHKLSKEEDYVERFKREVEISKTLSHPNIEKILSYGTYKGRYFIVYEYIEGQTLDKYIKSRKLPIKEIEDIILQVLNGLSYAHSRNVIHRDIKPSNIMVSKNGRVKILDFGIARATTKSTITKTGMFMGSPHYTSPEQIDGKRIDHRTDIYSLGIVLYEMAEGKVPFEADTPLGFVRAHLDKSVPRIKRDIPDYLEETIYKCLEKHPSNRFADISEIVKILNDKSLNKRTIIRSISKDLSKEENKKPNIVKRRISGIATWMITIVIIVISVLTIIFIIEYNKAKSNDYENISTEEKFSESEAPKILKIVPSSVRVKPLEDVHLSFESENSNYDSIEWIVGGGILRDKYSKDTVWEAPTNPGDYSISVTIKNKNNGSHTKTIMIKVVNDSIGLENEEEILEEIEKTDNLTENIKEETITNINLKTIYGPQLIENFCVYRVKLDTNGKVPSSIKWSKDDSLGTFGKDVAQVNINQGEIYTLTVEVTDQEGNKLNKSIELKDNVHRVSEIPNNNINGVIFKKFTFAEKVNGYNSFVNPNNNFNNISKLYVYFEYERLGSPVEILFKWYKNGKYYSEWKTTTEYLPNGYYMNWYENLSKGQYGVEIFANGSLILSGNCKIN